LIINKEYFITINSIKISMHF